MGDSNREVTGQNAGVQNPMKVIHLLLVMIMCLLLLKMQLKDLGFSLLYKKTINITFDIPFLI